MQGQHAGLVPGPAGSGAFVREALALLIAALAAGACSNSEPPSPPARADGVSEAAVWIGGADGGAWVHCQEGVPLRCAVWAESGDLWSQGEFKPSGGPPGPFASWSSQLVGRDGTRILLTNGRSLEGPGGGSL